MNETDKNLCIALAGAILVLILISSGCTSRGGWPRFLRPGELPDGVTRRLEDDAPHYRAHSVDDMMQGSKPDWQDTVGR
jgi:hypothetical protein